MATRSHSRFTDDIYCTPVSTSSKIHVKTINVLRDEMFVSNLYHEYHDGKQYLPSPNKSILITRWKPFISIIEANDRPSTIIEFSADVFSHLLAQDELQVLECVELAAVRQYFTQAINTVVLISHTKRVINLDTKEIYGNAFAHATLEQLRSAFQSNYPSQVVNLIAIEAPSHGEGCYTDDQISYIVANCYASFKAAQILAPKTHAMNLHTSRSSDRNLSYKDANHFHTIIHTGWWGCGAYGNNRQMMIITQMLAAHWAQINKIIFHTQNNEHANDIANAKEIFENLKSQQQAKAVIDAIHKII
ncbi:unnamed protein product [Rotaria socialis]|uniref:PARG catalytic Macro domain-containing protein n=1 Tax=Rotaria socialis TaxID=392032 RepID=A0A820ALK6_9BILA|nr:unnamed protein product [Rotaria socialis]CAF4192811.1 unnamed protein product [Rotaria socialis]